MKQLIFLLLLLVVFINMEAQDRITGKSFATRSEVIARNGMACTSQPLATQVALDILKKGGNAIDAAIAANAMLGLVEPTGNGMGGDIFAIVWDAKTRKLYGLNGSGRSPYDLTIDYFLKNGYKHIPPTGPLRFRSQGVLTAGRVAQAFWKIAYERRSGACHRVRARWISG
jgi:gamma-glutamyltranspeptidase/glutathione hydrolase